MYEMDEIDLSTPVHQWLPVLVIQTYVKELKRCFCEEPNLSYKWSQYIKKTIEEMYVGPELKEKLYQYLSCHSVMLENRVGPASNWTFTYFGYTDEYLQELKRKVEERGIYVRFERYTLRSRSPGYTEINDIELAADEPRLYGYILTDRPYRADEIKDIIGDAHDYQVTCCNIIIKDHDRGLDEWYGDEKLHDAWYNL